MRASARLHGCVQAREHPSVQQAWWCGAMGDEGSEGEHTAAARAARLRGGLPKTREEVLDA